MITPPTISDILSRAADLIEPEGAWTRGGSRVPGGNTTWSTDPRAVSFCAVSAISRVAEGWTTSEAGEARDILRATVGLLPDQMLGDNWNDAPERKQPEVVAKLREASSKAKERGL